MKITELKNKRTETVKQMRAMLNKAEAAGRPDLSSSEKIQYNSLENEVDSLDERINREEGLSGTENKLRSQRDSNYHAGFEGGMNLKGYSLTRAIAGAASGRFDGVEAEYSAEQTRRTGKSPTGVFVPLNALTSTGGTSGSEGGSLFTPETGGFIDALRARMEVARLGATVLGGLSADVKLPRQSAASTASWETETSAPDESSPTFDQVSLSPKRLTAFTQFSKQLLVQTSGSVEQLVRNDLLGAVALAIDAAAIAGTGTNNQPTGILSSAGLTKVALGAAGAAPTYASLVALLSTIASANADAGTIAFLSNPSVRAKLQSVLFDAGSGLTIWDKSQALGAWGISTNCPANLTKSTGTNLSAIIAGDFSQVIIGQFGASADVVVDPYTRATEGITRVVVNSFVDVAIRRAAYFAAIVDAITV